MMMKFNELSFLILFSHQYLWVCNHPQHLIPPSPPPPPHTHTHTPLYIYIQNTSACTMQDFLVIT
ncbi:hypothetical protein Hanom_Chr02g00104791 [Helianthus anomalus]